MVVITGLLEDLSVCRGCILSHDQAYELDVSHESVMHMKCFLILLSTPFLLLFFCQEECQGHAPGRAPAVYD